MKLPGWLPALILLTMAATSGYMLWKMQRAEQEEPLVGPPRSDYFLADYELVVLDENGNESFRVNGPRLSRHLHLGSYVLESPQFSFPGQDGQAWTAQAKQAWAASDGKELLLDGDVSLDGHSQNEGALGFRAQNLRIHPRESRAETDGWVTFTSPRSILNGRVFRADLHTRRFQLMHEVTGHYDSPHAKPTP